jgi:hypothetical protein
MDQSAWQRGFSEAAKREQARVAAEISDAQIRVLSAVFDKAVAYTNLIMLGGYAGFFGLWQLTSSSLTKTLSMWAALLVFISLVTFVGYEIFKMVIGSRLIDKQQRGRLRIRNARLIRSL